MNSVTITVHTSRAAPVQQIDRPTCEVSPTFQIGDFQPRRRDCRRIQRTPSAPDLARPVNGARQPVRHHAEQTGNASQQEHRGHGQLDGLLDEQRALG